MKSYFRFLMLATAVLLVASCQKATYLKVDNDTVKASIEGASGDIKIETDGGSVEIVHAPKWVKTTLNEKDTVLHYEIPLNTDRKFREDSIVLKSSDLTCAIQVSQSFKATYIKFDKDVVTIPRKGGSVEVNVEVDATSPLHVDNMNIAKVNDRKITITLPETRETKGVKKTVKVSCDDISADLQIVQEVHICKSCGGTGFGNKPCSICNGQGLYCCQYTGKEACPVCKGFGYVD